MDFSIARNMLWENLVQLNHLKVKTSFSDSKCDNHYTYFCTIYKYLLSDAGGGVSTSSIVLLDRWTDFSQPKDDAQNFILVRQLATLPLNGPVESIMYM